MTTTVLYDFSGGMESAAMLVVDRERIENLGAVIRWVDTGKHFPEMYDSVAQIEARLGLTIARVPLRVTFDEYLYERGGSLKRGWNDCSRKMKRSNLSRHMRTFPKPWEVNLGFNSGETNRADAFTDRNERDHLHWRYPLIEAGISREQTKIVCEDAGFSILVAMYEKMGRFDCFWCPNQSDTQAKLVIQHYPALAQEWSDAEDRKGYSFRSVPLKVLAQTTACSPEPESKCGCFGGQETLFDDED